MTTILPAPGQALSEEVLGRAASTLREGRPVVLPTDTVYGLAVALSEPGATRHLFELKRRPRHVELPVLVADLEQAEAVASPVPDLARALAARFWPGALTLVLPRHPQVEADLGGDGRTVGIRCPDHPVARALCGLVGPLATTSANIHGQATPATAAQVAEMFGEEVGLVLDGGRCEGDPSTVVDCSRGEPVLLRAGRLRWEEVRAAVGVDTGAHSDDPPGPRRPGTPALG